MAKASKPVTPPVVPAPDPPAAEPTKPATEPTKPTAIPYGTIPAALLGAAYQAVADMHGAEIRFEGMGRVTRDGLKIMWVDRRR